MIELTQCPLVRHVAYHHLRSSWEWPCVEESNLKTLISFKILKTMEKIAYKLGSLGMDWAEEEDG
jgi:hypothetical protein